jgi:L-fuconolactonase
VPSSSGSGVSGAVSGGPAAARVVDSHVHLWGEAVADAAWLRGDRTTPLRRSFGVAELRAAVAGSGTTAVVAVTAEESLRETRRLLSLAEDAAPIAGVVGWVDVEKGDAVERDLEGLAAHAALVGIRQSVISRGDDWLDGTLVREAFGRLARRGLVAEMLVAPGQLAAVTRLARRWPDLRMVIDHLGNPPRDGAARILWSQDLRAAADCDNVRVKLSGLPFDEAGQQVADPSAIDEALAAFGSARLLVGSDWPVSTLEAPYPSVMAAYRAALGALSADERADVFGGAARRVYRLPRPAFSGTRGASSVG